MSRLLMFVRSVLFFFVFLFWTLVPTILFLWMLFFPQKYVFDSIRFWQRGFAWLTKIVVGIDYKLEGTENIPKGSCLIASKHQSAYETCILNVLFGNPAIVLKKELTYVPIWGWYAKASGLIPIDRKAGMKALSVMTRAARAAKEAGRKIVIFPQGTRVRPGLRKPYKVGVAALYQDLDLPVVPMALNSGLFWPKGQFLKKPGTVTIRFLPPIQPGLSRSAFLRELQDKLETASDDLARAG